MYARPFLVTVDKTAWIAVASIAISYVYTQKTAFPCPKIHL